MARVRRGAGAHLRPALAVVLGLVLVMAATASPAQEPGPRLVLLEDVDVTDGFQDVPMLIAEGRGYRIRCDSQAAEQAVIRGLGFVVGSFEIVSATDPVVQAAKPLENPSLCPTPEARLFTHSDQDSLDYYMMMPQAVDRLYSIGCRELAEALQLDIPTAKAANPFPLFEGRVHPIPCLAGTPFEPEPRTFAEWCRRSSITGDERRTVAALLDRTPFGAVGLGNAAVCKDAADFLSKVPRLYLDDVGLRSLAPLASLTELTWLSLANNRIEDISPLRELHILSSLDLAGNAVSRIEAVAAMPNLRHLDLRNNAVTDLAPLAALPALNTLLLDGNHPRSLAPLATLQGLQELLLARTGVTGEMLEPLLSLPALRVLDVSGNRIRNMNVVAAFPSTVSLDLAENPVIEAGGLGLEALCVLHRARATPLGQTVRVLLALESLQQEGQEAPSCEDLVASLRLMTELDLNGRGISELAPLATLTQLVELNLAGNGVRDVSVLGGLERLQRLDLSNNSISDIAPLGSIADLRELQLAGNPLSLSGFLEGCLARDTEGALSEEERREIEVLREISGRMNCREALWTLQSMTAADLSDRNLASIRFLPVMSNLMRLDLSGNALADATALASMHKLTELRAAGNAFISLESLAGLGALEELDFSRNPLADLDGLGRLQRLKRLDISATQIASILPLNALPSLESVRMRELAFDFSLFEEHCLAHRLDPEVLGPDRPFMSALASQFAAGPSSHLDCREAADRASSETLLLLNGQGIRSVALLRFFPELRELHLSDNAIIDATPLAGLKHLRRIRLDHNRLQALPPLAATGLEELSVADNELSDLEALGGLHALKRLDASSNRVSDARILVDARMLGQIDLSDNRIRGVNAVEGLLDRTLDLNGNPVCREAWPKAAAGNQKLRLACGLPFEEPGIAQPVYDICREIPIACAPEPCLKWPESCGVIDRRMVPGIIPDPVDPVVLPQRLERAPNTFQFR